MASVLWGHANFFLLLCFLLFVCLCGTCIFLPRLHLKCFKLDFSLIKSGIWNIIKVLQCKLCKFSLSQTLYPLSGVDMCDVRVCVCVYKYNNLIGSANWCSLSLFYSVFFSMVRKKCLYFRTTCVDFPWPFAGFKWAGLSLMKCWRSVDVFFFIIIIFILFLLLLM